MKNNFIEIQSKEDLIKPFQDGEKKHSNFKIGTEHEKFVFHLDTHKPVSFSEENGIENLLIALKKYGQKINIALKLSVNLETIKKRISDRKNLENRKDDNEEIAIKRFETYEDNIKPVINFYKDYNLLKVVNGEASVSEISAEISDIIKGIKG